MKRNRITNTVLGACITATSFWATSVLAAPLGTIDFQATQQPRIAPNGNKYFIAPAAVSPRIVFREQSSDSEEQKIFSRLEKDAKGEFKEQLEPLSAIGIHSIVARIKNEDGSTRLIRDRFEIRKRPYGKAAIALNEIKCLDYGGQKRFFGRISLQSEQSAAASIYPSLIHLAFADEKGNSHYAWNELGGVETNESACGVEIEFDIALPRSVNEFCPTTLMLYATGEQGGERVDFRQRLKTNSTSSPENSGDCAIALANDKEVECYFESYPPILNPIPPATGADQGTSCGWDYAFSSSYALDGEAGSTSQANAQWFAADSNYTGCDGVTGAITDSHQQWAGGQSYDDLYHFRLEPYGRCNRECTCTYGQTAASTINAESDVSGTAGGKMGAHGHVITSAEHCEDVELAKGLVYGNPPASSIGSYSSGFDFEFNAHVVATGGGGGGGGQSGTSVVTVPQGFSYAELGHMNKICSEEKVTTCREQIGVWSGALGGANSCADNHTIGGGPQGQEQEAQVCVKKASAFAIIDVTAGFEHMFDKNCEDDKSESEEYEKGGEDAQQANGDRFGLYSWAIKY